MASCGRRTPTATIAVVVAVIAVALVLVAVFAYTSSGYPYGYSGYYGGMMGGFGGVWMLFMLPVGLIVLVVIGYFVWRACGWGWGGGCCGGGHGGYYASSGDRENALEILRQRYARGEISKEQYDQMRKDILS